MKLKNIKEMLTVFLLILPLLSVLAAAMFYWTLFLGLSPISTGILTLSDYTDRAVEFSIPITLMFTLIVGIYSLPISSKSPELASDEMQDQGKNPDEIAGKEIKPQRESFLRNNVFRALILVIVVHTIFFEQLHLAMTSSPVLLGMVAIVFDKNFTLSGRINSKAWSYISLIGLSGLFMISSGDAFKTRDDILWCLPSGEIVYLDTLENGELIGQDGLLIFKSNDREIEIREKINPFFQEPLACSLGIGGACYFRVKPKNSSPEIIPPLPL
jgi:hypothetical protein